MARARTSRGPTRPVSVSAALSIVAALSLCTGGAWADEPTPRRDDRARAQQLFDSALEDAQKGDFAHACPKFQASHLADPKASTLLNLANCYEKNGQTASAWGAFREAEIFARKTAHPDWETTARERAEALEPKLVRLTVSVAEGGRVPGLAVTRDGARLAEGEWGVAIPVDPGDHVVAATAPGKKPWQEHVKVDASNMTLDVPALEDEPAPPPALPEPVTALPKVEQPAPVPVYWTTLRKVGVGTAVVGAVGVGAGLIAGLVANGRYSDARQQCRDGVRNCPSSAVSDADYAYSLATGATVAFVVGAVVMAAGGTIFFLAPPGQAQGRGAPGAGPSIGLGGSGIVGAF